MKYLIGIALACLVAGAHAQHQTRYSWDKREKKCFAPGAEPTYQCREPTEQENYPTAEKTIWNIQAIYHNETYLLLERYLTELVASKKRFEDGMYAEEAIFRAFSRLMSADERYREGNAAWQKAAPQSKFTLLAEAARQRAAAWGARGTGYSNTVSKEAWELFAIRLQESEQTLLSAPKDLQDSPAWHLALLAVVMDSSRPQSNPQEVFDGAVKRWPTYAFFYQLVLNKMVPKWGGSWEQVEAFIVQANKMQPASEGGALYARLYIHLIPERSASESKFTWQTMKVGFEDAIARFPDPKYKNLYASYACMRRDKASFSQAMGKMKSEEIIPAWWLDGQPYKACLNWAGT